jgi:hypothetical protein
LRRSAGWLNSTIGWKEKYGYVENIPEKRIKGGGQMTQIRKRIVYCGG